MAAKVVILIVGLFVLALLDIAPGASQEISDGKVYTELKKTLVHGSSGILTCRFTGPPYAVFWKKGHDPWTSPTLLRWTPESKTGPRYEDGSCDITKNYSLVIKTVNYTDTGRYICFVSNQHGILIDNYTDVTVSDVGLETEPEISLEKGFAGILPCKLHVRPKLVTWKKGPTYSSSKIIVAIDKYHNVGKISGPGYEEGLFNITADYSLVIVYVENEDEGQYFCDLLEVDTDNTFQDSTNVSVFERDDNTTVEPRYKNCGFDQTKISLYVAIGVAAAAIIVPLVIFAIYFRKKLWYRSESSDPTPGHTPCSPEEDKLTKGRISNVELWTLVQSFKGSEENDKLSEAIKKLSRGQPEYGTCFTDFQLLCRWKDSCAPTETMDKLYKACSRAEMGEAVKKLKEFRYDVSKEVSKDDLDHVLWQIGKKSSENITTLLSNLMKTRFSQEPSVPKNVRRAFPVLQKWTKGNHAINPAVTLSLQSDEWCDEDKYFFTVPDKEKCPLEPAEIEKYVRNVSLTYCQKIICIISTKDKSKRNTKGKDVDTILDENKTDLFNTNQMIQEWLDEQECSNHEKRITLRKAVEDVTKASTSNEINLDEKEQLALSKGNAEAAYDLLMKYIKPFAANLGLDDSKLNKYKQLSPSSPSTGGTIGPVDVKPKKGKKWLKI